MSIPSHSPGLRRRVPACKRARNPRIPPPSIKDLEFIEFRELVYGGAICIASALRQSSHAATWFRPPRFALYTTSSARVMTHSKSPSPSPIAMPTLAVSAIDFSPHETGSAAIRCLFYSARYLASFKSSVARTIPNSSPPTRAMNSTSLSSSFARVKPTEVRPAN